MTQDGKYEIVDLQDLIIQKKFVRIESSKYTDEAYEYVKSLIDSEQAILFDKDTNRIYTLGDFYGGDELKQNLLYFTKLLKVDLDGEVIDQILATKNEDNLQIKAKEGITIDFIDNNGVSTIEFGADFNQLFNTHFIKREDGTGYNLFINENGQFDIEEYIAPKISLDITPLEYDEVIEDSEEMTIPINIESSIDIEDWEDFNITGDNCDIIDIDNDKVIVKVYKGDDATIYIHYNDGVSEDNIEVEVPWSDFAYYGVFDGDYTYTDLGKWSLGDIENTFVVDQSDYYYAFLMIPEEYSIIIYDDLSNIGGAWRKLKQKQIRNNHVYNVYQTVNEGMGKVRWKVIKNI